MNEASRNSSWRLDVFWIVAVACIIFFVLTLTAMLLYPGGSVVDPHSAGYAFFSNFFSDLGQTHTHAGQSNLPSMVLFSIALATTALGLALFFVAFARFFTRSGAVLWLSRAGVTCGIVTGICFVGVALTPWNLYLQAHNEFVIWAFRWFLAAVVLCLMAVLLSPNFPRRFAWVFGAFAALLAAYIVLLTIGPSHPVAAKGQQATGQKIVVYASVLTILVQALYARSLASGRLPWRDASSAVARNSSGRLRSCDWLQSCKSF